MREQFPVRGRGSRLTAKEVNDLGKVVRRIATGGISSYRSGAQWSGTVAQTGDPPFVQQRLEVVKDNMDGTYLVRPRYYNHAARAWFSDGTGNAYLLDPTDTGQTFALKDLLTGYWDAQRDAWIPLVGGGKPPEKPQETAETAIVQILDPNAAITDCKEVEDSPTTCVYSGVIATLDQSLNSFCSTDDPWLKGTESIWVLETSQCEPIGYLKVGELYNAIKLGRVTIGDDDDDDATRDIYAVNHNVIGTYFHGAIL